jgi:alanine-synthesizing transaminase
MEFLTDRVKSIESELRGKNYYTALEFEQKGEKVLKLNTGNPATFGFGMPDSVRAALLENLDKAVGYSDPEIISVFFQEYFVVFISCK